MGYGPDPGACIDLLRQQPFLSVAGNHDWAAVGKLDIAAFNPDAAAACLWTAGQLTPEQGHFLGELPLKLEVADFTLAHGSPRQPLWEYLLTPASAQANLEHYRTPSCLVGHSHVPLALEHRGGAFHYLDLAPGTSLKSEGRRLIINPGGVGQPRDGDPRASYLLYDGQQGSLRHFRIPYDVAITQRRMRDQGLPPRLIERLSYGL